MIGLSERTKKKTDSNKGNIMKIAFCNEVYGTWPLEKQFAFSAECGYDGMELAPFTLDKKWVSGEEKCADVTRITPKERDNMVKLAEKQGIKLPGLHWLLAKTDRFYLTSPYPETRRKTVEYFKALIELCADLGGEYMVLGSPQQRNILPNFSYDDGMKYAAEVLGETLEMLERNKITLALEPLAPAETNFLDCAKQAYDFIQFMENPKQLGIHLDCKAMAGGETCPIPELIRDERFVPYEKTFHANDPNLRGPGFGELDFGPIIAALAETGFDGWIGVEPFDYTAGVENLAKESVEYLRKFM